MSHRICNIVDICKIPGYELLDTNHFFILYKLKKKKKACYFAPEYRLCIYILPLYCFCPTESLPDS